MFYGTLGLSEILNFELILVLNNAQADIIIADLALAMKQSKQIISVVPTALVGQDDKITSIILKQSNALFTSSPIPIYQIFEMTTRDTVIYQNIGYEKFWILYDNKNLPYNNFWNDSNENNIIIGKLLYEKDYNIADFKNEHKKFNEQYLGTSIILASILGKHIDIANYILDNQLENVDCIDEYGNTLLHYLFKPEYCNSVLISKISSSFTRWDFKNMYGDSVNDFINGQQ